jgi:PAS domain S-box-containing protein
VKDGAARERVRAAIDAAVDGEASVFDTMVRAADGRELHVDFSCEPLRDIDAGIHSVLIEGWNVSRRVRTEQALRASQAIFAGILSIAADAIISIDEQQRIVHFNQGAEHIFGYAPEEAIGLPLDFLLPERFRAAHAAFVEHFGRAGETARRMGHRREIFGLRKNGEEFPAEASISKLDTPDRRLYTVVLRDITDRKRIEQSQRFLATAGGLLTRSLDEEATIQTVVQLPIGALADLCILDLLDDAGRFHRHASEARDPGIASLVRRLTTEFPLTWDSPSRVIDVMRTGEPELVAQLDDEWLAAHAEYDAQLAIARQLRIRSLMILPLVARESVVGTMTLVALGPGRPFDGADLQVGNELALRAAFAIDNARLYGAAQRATRARDEVLGVVSHDLRNPISAVAMITRTLLDQLPPDREADRELLENAYRSTEWMQRLIQDLLDVANIEAGKLSIERRPEPVEPMLDRAVAMFERQAAERSITLRVVAPPRLPAAHADAERIVQVIANLLSNALKYTDAGGAVSVEAVTRSQEVVVSVRDTGAGIPAEHLPHLFERYWQARRSARKRGSGLGLAIARGIVEAHGGRIEATSTIGQGSTFTFTLPVSPGD